LFTAFLVVSLCGVGGGGGIVLARRIAVENRRWISDRELADIVSLCQFMPGPNIVGIAVCVGSKMRGTIGTIAALSGFLVVPWTIGLSLGLLFLEYAHLTVIRKHPLWDRRDGRRASDCNRHKAASAASPPPSSLALCWARLPSHHLR
jgi:chromate transporter